MQKILGNYPNFWVFSKKFQNNPDKFSTFLKIFAK